MTDEQAERLIAAVLAQTMLLQQLLPAMRKPRARKAKPLTTQEKALADRLLAESERRRRG